jgi:hypothetical protein
MCRAAEVQAVRAAAAARGMVTAAGVIRPAAAAAVAVLAKGIFI